MSAPARQSIPDGRHIAMNMTEQRQPIGSLKISKDVLATIAAMAAKEVEGVYGVAKGQISKAVAITLSDDIAVIDVRLVLEHTARIPTVSQRVQSAVKEAVQNMTGITVSKVNVVAAGVHYEEAIEND